MIKILVLIPYYFPGYKSGGPQQTIRNIIDAFGDKAQFYVYTLIHDFGSNNPYEGIKCNKWLKKGNAKVMYVSDQDYCGKKWSNKI